MNRNYKFHHPLGFVKNVLDWETNLISGDNARHGKKDMKRLLLEKTIMRSYVIILLSLTTISCGIMKKEQNREYYLYSHKVFLHEKWYFRCEKMDIFSYANDSLKEGNQIKYKNNDVYFIIDSNNRVTIKTDKLVFFKGISIKSRDTSNKTMLIFPISDLVYKHKMYSPLYTIEEWSLNNNNFNYYKHSKDSNLLNIATKYLDILDFSMSSHYGNNNHIVSIKKGNLIIRVVVRRNEREVHFKEYTFTKENLVNKDIEER